MKIGAMIFATDQTIRVTKLAPELEARGFESLWIPEKTHLPISRKTPWPGGTLPEWYKRASDPMIALAAAIGVTTKLRFEFGIGYGWNAEEYETHGVDIKQAPEIMREKIELMNELWQHDIGSYEGKYVSVAPSWSWPKPYQTPRPPIHIGARATKTVFADIAAYADGWMPIEGYGNIVSNIPKLHQAFEDAGRAPTDAKVSVYQASGEPDLIKKYVDAGIDRVIVSLPAIPEGELMKELDRLTTILMPYL